MQACWCARDAAMPALIIFPCGTDPSAVAVTKVMDILDDQYTPERALALFQGGSQPPKFLMDMIKDPDWRQVFIRLAKKHKTCPVLSFCIKQIVDVAWRDVFQTSRYGSPYRQNVCSLPPCPVVLTALACLVGFPSASAYREVTRKVLSHKLSEVGSWFTPVCLRRILTRAYGACAVDCSCSCVALDGLSVISQRSSASSATTRQRTCSRRRS